VGSVRSSVEEAREHERAYARRRAEEVAEKIPGEAALSALSVPRAPFVRAMLGAHAVAALRARGTKPAPSGWSRTSASLGATWVLTQACKRRHQWIPLRLGLAVPQSGAQARLGEVVLRGAMLVMAEPTASGDPSSYQLMVRDSDAPAERAGSAGAGGAAWSLAREESVIGLLGAPNPRGIELAARDGVPFLLLDDHAPGARTTRSNSSTRPSHAPSRWHSGRWLWARAASWCWGQTAPRASVWRGLQECPGGRRRHAGRAPHLRRRRHVVLRAGE